MNPEEQKRKINKAKLAKKLIEKSRIEKEGEKEMSETLKVFRASAKKEQKLIKTATDSEFWICICFQTLDHKSDFLDQSGLAAFGDKYIDGHKFAEALDIKLAPKIKKLPPFRKDKDWETLT